MGWSKLLDVEVGPFELATSLTVLPDGWRRALAAGAGALALLVVGSIALLPRDPGPRPTEEALRAGFCDRRPMACDEGLVDGIWAWDSYELWSSRQLAAWERHTLAADAIADTLDDHVRARLVGAALILLLGAALWRATRPIEIRRNGSGLWVAGVHVPPGQLAALESLTGLRLRLRTHDGASWVSWPLWIDPVELEALVALLDDDVVDVPELAERERGMRQRRAALALAARAR